MGTDSTNVIGMKKPENDENAAIIKALVYKASAFNKDGHSISIDKIEKIHSFILEEGDYVQGKYSFSGTATITIESLTQLYEFEGYANENEIIGSINIKKSH